MKNKIHTVRCHGGEYEYYDIINYKYCCTCKYFFEDFLSEQLECHKTDRVIDEDCFEFDDIRHDYCRFE